jgi:hypothetical protein
VPRPEELPESIILGQFTGMKNTVSQERLAPTELERATNVDIDDAGQLRRRRGYDRVIAAPFHSLKSIGGKVFGVRSGMLGRVLTDYSFISIVAVGDAPVAYTEVNGEVYFCNTMASGVIGLTDVLSAWGQTDGQGLWLSAVTTPTETLGAVRGKLLGDPIKATEIEAYKGRIYLADGKTLWATELFQYHYIDRTRGFMQFEHDITLLMAVDNGIYVGTVGGLYFIQVKLSHIGSDAVLAGSGQYVPAELVHPQARNAPIPTGEAAVFMTNSGIVAGFDGGTCYNLTSGTMAFPAGVSAAALFRQDQGANSYIAAVDSAGGPSANARIGDYVDAEIRRAVQGG